MNLTVKVDRILEIVEGSNAKGKFRMRNIIVTPFYQKKEGQVGLPSYLMFTDMNPICLTLRENLIDSELVRIGNEISIDFSVSSSEYNGKWYTDVVANRIEAIIG